MEGLLVCGGGNAQLLFEYCGKVQWVGKAGQQRNVFDRFDAPIKEGYGKFDPLRTKIFGVSDPHLHLEQMG